MTSSFVLKNIFMIAKITVSIKILNLMDRVKGEHKIRKKVVKKYLNSSHRYKSNITMFQLKHVCIFFINFHT